ncbi:C-type lectin domain family 4 member G-like [Mytilus edulis]|uniref:C-type lectin domain family 4 member G-like n=1 Tax=Mytilus edulis TaxID=6550 RepID=UPI0039EE8E4B
MYPYVKIGDSCYLINKEKVTWDIAFVKCLKQGAHLAVFETLDEILLMKYELHYMNTGSSFFIGGRNINRHISGGDWRWIKHGKMTKMTYFAFDAVQPNGSSRYPQDCLSLNGQQRLYDNNCDSYSVGFICEK